MQNGQPRPRIVCARGPLAEAILFEIAEPSRMPRKSPRNFKPHPAAPFEGRMFVGTIHGRDVPMELILQCGGVMDGQVLLMEVNEPRRFRFQIAQKGDPLFREGTEVVKVNSRAATKDKIPDWATSFASHLTSKKGITSRKHRDPELPRKSRARSGLFTTRLWDTE